MASVIMVGWAISAANNILAADTDTLTSAAAIAYRQHPSFQAFSPSLPLSWFCPRTINLSQLAREFT